MTTPSLLTLHYRGPRRRRGKVKGAENVFEKIIAGKLLNLGKETDIQVQKAQRVPNKMNPKISHQDTFIKIAKI